MKLQGGYMGKILYVDLSNLHAYSEAIPEKYQQKFLGGAGINAKLVYDQVAPGTDPLSSKNILAFGAGPFVGTLIPGAGKCNVTGKSPHLGVMAASGHGFLGMLKFTGHDHLVIKGKAPKPIYLKITNGHVEFVDAQGLWGTDVWETTDAIWDDCGEEYVVTAIGPAGENALKDASIITNKYAAMARSGLAGVMGAKNLKAIALYGTNSVEVADRKQFTVIVEELHAQLRSHPNIGDWRKFGTLISYETFAKLGLYAARNFQKGYGEELLDHLKLDDFLEIKKGDVACLGCPVGCKHYIEVPEQNEAVTISCVNSSLQSFGAFIDVKDWKSIVRLASRAGRMGLDFFSTGGLLAMAMELYQRGIIDKETTGGLELTWGNVEAAEQLIEQIAHKRGFGKILAEGLINAPEIIGKGASDYAMQTKGHAIFYDPRVRLGSTEIFSQFTNVRGHTSNVSVVMVPRTPEQVKRYAEKAGIPKERLPEVLSGENGYNVARLNKWCEDIVTVMDCLGVCIFPLFQRINMEQWTKLYQAVTGIETTVTDLLQAAQNLWDVRRAFNIREGITAEADSWPKRLHQEAVVIDGQEYPPLSAEGFRSLIQDYYDERGWDSTEGKLSKSRLEELEL
ncbi:MAG: aldehyde ferredoxin oxidoreductase family protein [Bacillota bacterium]